MHATIRLVTEQSTTTINDLSELSSWVKTFSNNLSSSDNSATVIALSGPLGVGKTTFVRELLENYGVDGPITSPTYTIETVYKLPAGPFSRAYHLDAYRLDGADDLRGLNFQERLEDKENIILIEWADRVKELLPSNTIFIKMSFTDEENRRAITKSFNE